MAFPRNGSSHEDALAGVVEQLCASALAAGGPQANGDKSLHYYVGATLDRVFHELGEQVARAIAFVDGHDVETCAHCRDRAERATVALLLRLPELRRLLASDVDAAFEGDPALKVKEDAIFSYPGVHAITEQRLAHELYVAEVREAPFELGAGI